MVCQYVHICISSAFVTDPYAVVSFEHYSDRSVLMKGTVSPKWNETLLFEHVHLCGHPEDVLRTPPKIVLQYFDKDNYVRTYMYNACLSRFVICTWTHTVGRV